MASLKQLAATGVAKKTDLFKVRVEDLCVEEGFNLRIEGNELEEHIATITQSILNGDDIPPLSVRVSDNQQVFVVDGHCRLRAYQKAMALGAPIEWIQVLPFTGNDADRVVKVISSSQGKSLTPIETAIGFKRLIRFGWNEDRIAKHFNKSRTHIDNLLMLANSNTEVQDLVSRGVVSATMAIETIRHEGENAGNILSGHIVTATKEGKTRITKKMIKASNIIPKKIMETVVEQLDKFIASIDDETKQKIIDLSNVPDEELIGVNIQIDASSFLNFIDAFKVVEEARNEARFAAQEKEDKAASKVKAEQEAATAHEHVLA